MNAFHALNVSLKVATFFEYVRSKANIGDLPSRGAVMELLRLLRADPASGKISEVKCRLPDMTAWHLHAADWTRGGHGGI